MDYIILKELGAPLLWDGHWFLERINLLYLLDAIVDFSQNHMDNKKLEVHLLIYLLNLRKIKSILLSNKYNIDLITSIIKRILKSAYIPDKYKTIIKNLINKMRFIN